jgi:hypothetical protein
MKYMLFGASGLDAMALGNVALTIFGLGLAVVSLKVSRATLEANKTSVELQIGLPQVETEVIGSNLCLTNLSSRLSLHNLFLGFVEDGDFSRDEFVSNAKHLVTRCHILDYGQTLKVALPAEHIDQICKSTKNAVVGFDYSVIDGLKPLHWHAENIAQVAK